MAGYGELLSNGITRFLKSMAVRFLIRLAIVGIMLLVMYVFIL